MQRYQLKLTILYLSEFLEEFKFNFSLIETLNIQVGTWLSNVLSIKKKNTFHHHNIIPFLFIVLFFILHLNILFSYYLVVICG